MKEECILVLKDGCGLSFLDYENFDKARLG